MKPESILLSIVVCTYRRPDYLSRLLDSLVIQKFREIFKYEVILIENDTAPSPAFANVANQFLDRLPIRLGFTSPPNLSDARNLGVKTAQGEYIAFLDDDAVPNPGWLTAMFDGIKNCSPDAFCGPIYPLFNFSKPKWFSKEFEESEKANYYGEFDKNLAKENHLAGGNFGISKKLFTSLGGFSNEVGMRNGSLGYGEETLLINKAWKTNQNLSVVYFKDAHVFHEVHVAKYKMSFYIKSAYAHGRDWAKYQEPRLSKGKYFLRFSWHSLFLMISVIQFGILLLVGRVIYGNENWWRKIGQCIKSISADIYAVTMNGINLLNKQ